MKISDEAEKEIDRFISAFIDFAKSGDSNKHYKSFSRYNPDSGIIEMKSGILVPAKEESVLVLDKEYEQFLFQQTHTFVAALMQDIESKLFGFAERSFMEFTTVWLFITFHPNIAPTQKNRVKTLLFAGHYKIILENENDLKIYLKLRGKFLHQSDISYLKRTDITHKLYFNRLRKKALKIAENSAGREQMSVISRISNASGIKSFQSMQVHANPLSLNEAFANKETRIRRKLLVAIICAQICAYFDDRGDSAEASRLLAEFNGFASHLKIDRS